MPYKSKKLSFFIKGNIYLFILLFVTNKLYLGSKGKSVLTSNSKDAFFIYNNNNIK